MVSTFTPNINLEEPARGDDVGVWDTPVNNNMSLIDLVAGGRTTISGAAGSVTLAAAQYECKTITFNSTLLASIAITFPTSFTKSYEIYHTCTGSSVFTITLQTTAAGGQVICASPGEIIDVINDGTNLRYKNFGRVGSYWDYAGSSTPNWNDGCTVKPWLNCDGTTFSSATYPALTTILGSTTLPNSKGRTRFALDQGAGVISTAATGFSTTGVGATGGGQTTTLGTSNLPAYTPAGTGYVTQTVTTAQLGLLFVGAGAVQFGGTGSGGNTTPISSINTSLAFTGTPQGGVSQAMTNLPPAYIGGLTLIRSA